MLSPEEISVIEDWHVRTDAALPFIQSLYVRNQMTKLCAEQRQWIMKQWDAFRDAAQYQEKTGD